MVTAPCLITVIFPPAQETNVEGSAPFLSPSETNSETSEANSASIAATVSSTGLPLLFTLVLKIGQPHCSIISRIHASPGHLKATVFGLSASGLSALQLTMTVSAPGHFERSESGRASFV